jgi:hypothetical protein
MNSRKLRIKRRKSPEIVVNVWQYDQNGVDGFYYENDEVSKRMQNIGFIPRVGDSLTFFMNDKDDTEYWLEVKSVSVFHNQGAMKIQIFCKEDN